MVRRRFWSLLLVAVLMTGVLSVAVALAGSSSTARTASPASLASTPAPGEILHVVQSGETLGAIARRYGVGVWDLAIYNGIANPDRIYAGQRLRIPRQTRPTAALPTPTPTAAACPCEEIVIQSPAPGITITSPVTVSGLASSPFEQTVVVAVLDGSGAQIGLAPATITGEYGQQGPFSVTVPFAVPANSQAGRIQVYTTSPRDGALEHLSSVSVMVQGAALDLLLEQLEAAVNTKDYDALRSLMGPAFALSLYRSEEVELAPDEAIARLRSSYLGPGAPRLDFSVDARALLADHVALSSDIGHVVYSTGWGADRGDDAFLLIGDIEGRARWIGMLYVPRGQIDYRTAAQQRTG